MILSRSRFLLLFTAILLAAQTAPEVEITAEPHHHLVLENEYVRAFNVEVPPRSATLLHWHRHNYVSVMLGSSHISNEVKGKAAIEIKLQDGEARFSPAGFAHVARNLGDTSFRNIAIEFMKSGDKEERQSSNSNSPATNSPTSSPSGAKDDRGLEIFSGGTRQILFVRDGVRVSEIELQPGGVVPRHHHNGPHLLVAVSDLDVRSDVEGKAPMPGQLKSGEVKWLPGGYTHTLTNVSKAPAKFVTLEFP